MTRWFLLVGLAGLCAVPASAQPGATPSELRRENDLLRERVHALEAAVARMEAEIDRLNAMLASLEGELAAAQAMLEEERARRSEAEVNGPPAEAADAPAPDPPSEPAIDWSQRPFAAPDALFAALQREYDAAFGDMPRETDEERAAFFREARRWINQIKLHRRSAVEWLVEFTSIGSPQSQVVECEALVIHPETDEPIGESFRLRLVGRDALRVLETPGQARWTLTGNLAAKPELNETRAERGVFNTPRLIGPYVEFAYELTVRSIRAAPDEAAGD